MVVAGSRRRTRVRATIGAGTTRPVVINIFGLQSIAVEDGQGEGGLGPFMAIRYISYALARGGTNILWSIFCHLSPYGSKLAG